MNQWGGRTGLRWEWRAGKGVSLLCSLQVDRTNHNATVMINDCYCHATLGAYCLVHIEEVSTDTIKKKCSFVSKYTKLALRIVSVASYNSISTFSHSDAPRFSHDKSNSIFFSPPLVFRLPGVSWRLCVHGSIRQQSRDGGLPLCLRHGWKEGPWDQPHNAHASHRLHSPQDMQVMHISTQATHKVLTNVNTHHMGNC